MVTLMTGCLAAISWMTTLLYLTQNVFGMNWARAVSGETGLGWDSEKLALPVYDMARAFIAASLTAGMVQAAIGARWLVHGISCHMMVIFALWVLFAVGAFIPLLVFYSIDFFNDENEGTKGCNVFDTGGSDWDKGICWWKWVGVLSGTAVLAGVVGVQIVAGAGHYFPRCFQLPMRPKIATSQREQMDSAAADSARQQAEGAHYVSDEPFFNFKIGPETTQRLMNTHTNEGVPGALPLSTPRGLPLFKLPANLEV